MRLVGRVAFGLAMVAGSRTNLIAQADEQLIIVGAGNSGSWHTEFEFANSLDAPIHAGVGILETAGDACVTGFCPVKGFDMPARGVSREDSEGPPTVWDGVHTYIVGSYDPLPTTRAWLVNAAQPTQTVELPVARLSSIARLQPTMLAFPSAERTPSSHSNLVIAEVGNSGDLSITVEALSSGGELLGSEGFTVPALRTLFLTDVLRRLGVAELPSGQIRVRKVNESGLMWGLVTILHEDGRISVSQGANP